MRGRSLGSVCRWLPKPWHSTTTSPASTLNLVYSRKRTKHMLVEIFLDSSLFMSDCEFMSLRFNLDSPSIHTSKSVPRRIMTPTIWLRIKGDRRRNGMAYRGYRLIAGARTPHRERQLIEWQSTCTNRYMHTVLPRGPTDDPSKYLD